MKLKEIMTGNVETITIDAPIQEAARKMAALGVGFLPVIDATKPCGVVTDRDITVRAVADGRDPVSTPVSEVMTSEIVTLSEESEAEEAANLMEQRQIRRILVVGEHERFVGVVSLGDLAVKLAEDELSGEALRRVSEPAAPK